MKRSLLLFASILMAGLTYAQPFIIGTTNTGGNYGKGVLYYFDAATSSFNKILNFAGLNGEHPSGELTLAPDKKLYGYTTRGGQYGKGTLYSYYPLYNRYSKLYDVAGNGVPKYLIPGSPTQFYANDDTAIYKFDVSTKTFLKLYSFDPAGYSERFLGPLTLTGNGKLYGFRAFGSTNYGGQLICFDPQTAVYSVKHEFISAEVGSWPNERLTPGTDGKLYGTTSYADNNYGMIFQFDPLNDQVSRSYIPIQTEAGRLSSPLRTGADGKMTGFSTENGGVYSLGTVYSFSPQGNVFTRLIDLDQNYFDQVSTWGRQMIRAADNNLYSVLPNEGPGNAGTFYTYRPLTKTILTLFEFGGVDGVVPSFESLVEYPALFTIQCPGNKLVKAGADCKAVVAGLDPVFFPNNSPLTYTMTGATTGSGAGSVSGKTFNAGVTTVAYTMGSDPARTCSFTVTVQDKTPPVLTVASSVFHRDDDVISPGNYSVPPASAKDNCAGVVSYRFLVKTESGYVLRSGNTNDASGSFPEGKTLVQWTAKDAAGNTATDTTTVLINRLNSTSRPVFIGTTHSGGKYGKGVLYYFDAATSSYNKIMNFAGLNGENPASGLTLAPDKKLYGYTTRGGLYGKGTLYSYYPLYNRYSKLYDVAGNGVPKCLVMGSPTQFYANDDTAIYKFDVSTKTFQKLYSFDPGETNESFQGPLTLAGNGKLYGFRGGGENNYLGEIVCFDPQTAVYSVKYSFNSGPGNFPTGTLTLGTDGKLYGTTSDAYQNQYGLIFQFDPQSDSYKTVYVPNKWQAGRLSSSLQTGADGQMTGFSTEYGGAYGFGSVYSFSPQGNVFTKLIDLDQNYYDQVYLEAKGMLRATDNNLYSVTPDGGTGNAGTFYTYRPSTKAIITLFDFGGVDGVAPTTLIEYPVLFTMQCPGNKLVKAGADCKSVIPGLDPVIFPKNSPLTYTMTGATTGSGAGSVSGKTFNAGVTTVVYTLGGDPARTCSFTLTVTCTPSSLVTSLPVERGGVSIAVQNGTAAGVMLYPNPTTGLLGVSYNSLISTKLSLKIYDGSGRLVFSRMEKAISGVNNYSLDLSHLASADYYLEVSNDKQKRDRRKFIILK